MQISYWPSNPIYSFENFLLKCHCFESFKPVLYISLIYRIYRRDIQEADILFGICRDISDILNVSRHIVKISQDDGKYRSAGKKRWNSILQQIFCLMHSVASKIMGVGQIEGWSHYVCSTFFIILWMNLAWSKTMISSLIFFLIICCIISSLSYKNTCRPLYIKRKFI
jgi:hypothetical protein